MLLYIHVPFCQQKCAYCAFYSLPLTTAASTSLSRGASSPGSHPTPQSCLASQGQPLANAKRLPLLEIYCQTLEAEIALRATQAEQRVTSIFFGGGTPSLLSSRQVEHILNTLQRHFSLAPGVEITMEANPESASRAHWLHEIRQAGVNRLSLGAQSFHHEELSLLGRKHSVEDVQRTVSLAHQAQFSSLSLDLMWGIPRLAREPSSFTERWLSSLKAALELSPHHISAYGLILEEGTPLTQQAEAIESSLLFPSEEEEQTMYKEGIELLASYGLKQYEISNYALNGHQCRHNIGYWQGAEYYGFGPSAVSTLGTTRFANTSHLDSWQEGITKGTPQGEEERLTPSMLQEEKVMLSLRMTKGLNAKDWNDICPTPLKQLPLVQQLCADKLATFNDQHLALTPSGMMVSNAIISRLFESII